MPALFTSISILLFDEILFTASFTCSNFETSTTLESKFLLSISLTAFDNSASSISQIKTFAPKLKKVLAISKPNPCAPPVIIAVLSFKSKLFIKPYLLTRR